MKSTLSRSPLVLNLKTTWNLATSSSDYRTNILVQLDEGFGEIAVVPHYGISLVEMEKEFDRAKMLLDQSNILNDHFLIYSAIELLKKNNVLMPVICGIDLALHDRLAKRLNVPLYRLFGLNTTSVPATCFSIGMDAPEKMAKSALDSGFNQFKIKLGRPEDLEMVSAIKKAVPNAKVRLDPNAGWSREEAQKKIPELMKLGVDFIEQPLSKSDKEGFKWLKSQFAVPFFADESFQTEKDLIDLAPYIDGVVIKLSKSGGLLGAKRQIDLAKTLNLKIMMSCMIESSLSVSAAAQLAMFAEYSDLDGPLLISNDPFEGLTYGEDGKILLADRPGIGASLKKS